MIEFYMPRSFQMKMKENGVDTCRWLVAKRCVLVMLDSLSVNHSTANIIILFIYFVNIYNLSISSMLLRLKCYYHWEPILVYMYRVKLDNHEAAHRLT